MTFVFGEAALARLRWIGLAGGMWFHGSSHGSAQAAAERDGEVTLTELLAFAEEHAPASHVAFERQGYADASRLAASPRLRQNPTLELGIGPRFSGTRDSDFDFVAALGQPVEIGGQRSARLTAATRHSEQLAAELHTARFQVRRDVTLAYRAAAVARARVAIAARLSGFANDLLTISQKRLAAGDATGIDVRIAESEQAQARQNELLTAQALRSARIDLAKVSGWPIATPPNVEAELPPAPPAPSLDKVMGAAAARHPQLRAARAAIAHAQAETNVETREARASPVVGVQVAREGSAGSPANYIVLGTVGTTLPFAQRNQGARKRAEVDAGVAKAEERVVARALEAEIARAHAELNTASERLAIFSAGLTPKLEENLTLLQRAFDAGELPLLTVTLARERFFQTQSAALSAYADYYRALSELEFALGAPLPFADAATTGVTP